MPDISREELTKLPYYEGQNPAGRVVQLRSYFSVEDEQWQLYLPVKEGELGRIAGGEIIHGTYFGNGPADPETDVPFPLGTFVARYASWQDVAVVGDKMESDLLQLASLFGKLNLITESKDLTNTERSALLESEVEHLMTLTRSFYDLLQKFSKRLAAKVVDPEDQESQVFQELPQSFADITLHGNEPRSKEEITEKYGLHDELAEFYASEAATFVLLREIRVGLMHHGKRTPTIYILEEGPAIDVRESPWGDLPIWDETDLIRERFGSIRALVADSARRCFAITTRYARAFGARVAVPSPLINEVDVFLRGPYTAALNRLDEIVADPWEARNIGEE